MQDILHFIKKALKFNLSCLLYVAAHLPLTKHLKVVIIDSNPALGKRDCINKEDPPDPRVSTVTPATISYFKGIASTIELVVSFSLCVFIYIPFGINLGISISGFYSNFKIVVMQIFMSNCCSELIMI